MFNSVPMDNRLAIFPFGNAIPVLGQTPATVSAASWDRKKLAPIYACIEERDTMQSLDMNPFNSAPKQSGAKQRPPVAKTSQIANKLMRGYRAAQARRCQRHGIVAAESFWSRSLHRRCMFEQHRPVIEEGQRLRYLWLRQDTD